MKRILLITSCLLAALLCGAQTTKEEFMADPSVWTGYHYPYHYSTDPLTKAPKGYKPFYIYHFGRHGSRFDINTEGPAYLLDVLTKARKAKGLTEDGEYLMKVVAEYAEYARGRGGELSALGYREHSQIAERMFNNFPEVFKGKDVKVIARSSDVPRCIVSMASFCSQLRAMNPKMDISMDSSPRYHYYVKNGTGITARGKGYKKYTKAFNEAHPYDVQSFNDKVFLPAYQKKLKNGGVDFMEEFMNMYKYFDCTGFGPEKLVGFVSVEDLYADWVRSTYYFYVKYGPSPVYDKLLVGSSHKHVEQFKVLVNEAIAGRGPAANLQFSHDSMVLPFMALLNIDGADTKETDPEKVSLIFSDYKRVCKAANLQFVFYRSKKSDDVLFKILHNEKEVLIPGVETVSGPYYSWKAVQPYIGSRLEMYPFPNVKGAEE